MLANTLIFNKTLSIFTLAGQIFVIATIIFFIKYKNKKGASRPLQFLAKHSIALSFFIALMSTIGSLLYSEVLGFQPCVLCWYQRIFIYPQIILLGLALWRKDRGITAYSIALALISGAIGTYHYYGQMFNPSALPCAVIGLTPACSQRFIVELGYITIPMMSITASAMIIALMLANKWHNVENAQ